MQFDVLVHQIIPTAINEICESHYHIPGKLVLLSPSSTPLSANSYVEDEGMGQIEHRKKYKLQKEDKKLLKGWMISNRVFQNELYETLIINGITSTQKIKELKMNSFENIAHQFRTEQFSKVKSLKERRRLNELFDRLKRTIFVLN